MKTQFADYISDTPVISKQVRNQQTWYELVYLKEGYNSTKFDRSRFNSVLEQENDGFLFVCLFVFVFFFFKWEICQLSPLKYAPKLKLVYTPVIDITKIHTKF